VGSVGEDEGGATQEVLSRGVARALALGVTLALVGAGLSRWGAAGVERRALVLEGPGGLRVPALHLLPDEPQGSALLVHGITASKESMLCLAEALAESGLECLALDLPGHGRSPHPFERQRLRPAIRLAAHTLHARGEIDLYVGHSLGANVGQLCATSGAVRPRVFVALGSYPSLAPGGRLEAVLALVGRYDLLVPPARVRAAAASQSNPPEVVVSDTADHLLEPFDPTLVERVRALAPRPPPTRSRAWLARLAGLLCLALACFPLAACVLPSRRLEGRAALARGALSASIALACAACALSPGWVDLWPTARSLPWWPALSLAIGLASWTASRPVAHALGERELPPATCAHTLFVIGTAAPALALALGGSRFSAFMLALGCVALAAATLFAWFVERRAGPLAASASFALVAAYVPALWAPILL
jgi:pimeloyl-ACP methyl ester carboxylesterase